MMRLILILLCFSFFGAVRAQTKVSYREKTLILKVKPEFENQCELNNIDVEVLDELKKMLGVESIRKKFPKSEKTALSSRFANDPFVDRHVDITTIYEWKYTSDISVPKAVFAAKKTGAFVYVEPAFIYNVLLVPNDELVGSQYHLTNIKAYEAFDLDTNASEITIGIIDTGSDWDHPDLVNAIRYNENDLFDGVDNDGNGLIDDFRGWNFHDDNNDPDEKSWSHGTHVAGLAAASSNNGIGTVGTSYSAKFIPIKAGHQLTIGYGYEGVVYAADMGCKIINCSWGGRSFSEFGYDAVRYATYNKGALITAGAGNNNLDLKFYPASFPEVVSVGGTDAQDAKYDFSNFNFDVDIIAPGSKVFSTKNDGTYAIENGTSMSAPIVAGAAALVLQKYPYLKPAQLKAHLKNTANKSVLNLPSNLPYAEKLGAGLLDMRAALDTVSAPYVSVEQVNITDNADEAYTLNDIVEISFELVNYLLATKELTIVLSPFDSNGNVTMIDSVWNPGILKTNQRKNNYSNPFRFQITNENGAFNQPLSFRVKISDGSFSTTDYIEMNIKPDYVNVAVNNITTTIASNGLIGFTDYFQTNGLGFELNKVGNLLYEGGLMIGHKSSVRKQVVDRVRGEELYDRDLTSKVYISESAPYELEAFRASGSFVDTSARLDEIGLEIIQTVTAFDDDSSMNYVIIEYDVINKLNKDLDSINVGLFADWDIENSSNNRAKTVSPLKLGYIYNVDGEDICAGIQLLSDYRFNSYMIENTSEGGGGILINDDDRFSTEDKYQALTGNRLEAGFEKETGEDVIQIISTTGLSLRKEDTLKVRYALMAARSESEIIRIARNAYIKENGYAPGENVSGDFEMYSLFPVPAEDFLNMKFGLKKESNLSFEIYDVFGRTASTFPSKSFFQGDSQHRLNISRLSRGVYFLRIVGDNFEITFPFSKHI